MLGRAEPKRTDERAEPLLSGSVRANDATYEEAMAQHLFPKIRRGTRNVTEVELL